MGIDFSSMPSKWNWQNDPAGTIVNEGSALGVGKALKGDLSGLDILGLGGAAGFTNPNDTEQGKALQAQKGDTVTWGSTANTANTRLGADINAPQVGSMAPVVVGTDANNQPIYGPSGNTVAAPTWQQAKVTPAQAYQMQAAQAQAEQMRGAQLDATQSNQARVGQNALVGSLQGTAAGQGPSVAQELLRQNTAANINQQQSAAQSAHGAARLAALRNAQMTGAATQQTANSQAAGLRAQEIASAQGNLGNVLGVQRGQDVTTANQNAQLQQQTGQTNATLGQQNNQFNAGLAQGAGQYNANALNANSQFNSGAYNSAAQNYANQQNAGNLSLANMNLGAQMNTNQLNTQRGIAQVNAQQGAAQGQTGIDTTAYQGTLGYNQNKTQMLGQGPNAVGQALPALGALL